MSKYILLALALLLAPLFLACQTAQPANQPAEVVSVGDGSYRNVTAQALRSMLASKSFVLVDVHTPNQGYIAGTDLRIPYNQIEDKLAQLPADKNAAIVLYCRSGAMSKIAGENLVRLGYRNVTNLKGGMVAWQDAGYPLEAN